MRVSFYTVEIDSLILDGFDVSPGQAEHVRALVETELQRCMGQEGARARSETRQTDYLSAASLAWQPSDGEHALAAGIAQQVAQAVQGQIRQGG
jgi:hypothetical protein